MNVQHVWQRYITIIKNKVSNVPNYKDFLRNQIQKASLTLDKQQEVLHMLNKLPDGNTLCHGDFHPGNIIISGRGICYRLHEYMQWKFFV